jgi:SAM-dependent methyltransferase
MKYATNYNKSIYNWIIDNVTRNMSILDFGAGIGEYCNRLHEYGYNVQALEIDKNMHCYIKCRCYASLDELQNKFDLIYLVNVLEHIQNEKDILGQLYSILNKGGLLKIFVPAKQILYSSMDEKVGHYRRYEKKTLISVVKSCGYKIITCEYFDAIGFFISLAYKIFNKTGDITKSQILMYDKLIFPCSMLLDLCLCRSIVGKNLRLVARK